MRTFIAAGLLCGFASSMAMGQTLPNRFFHLAQTQRYLGSEHEYNQRCRDTNLPGKRFYLDHDNAGRRGYCCTTPDKNQGWCCWDKGQGNFSCAAR